MDSTGLETHRLVSVSLQARVKAIFVGINYESVQGCQNLRGIPYVYAKSMLWVLTGRLKKTIPDLGEENCRFFTDKSDVKGLQVETSTPTKENVLHAFKEMVSSARAGDVLLFYFCGHGANEYQSSRGAIKTLTTDLARPNVIYSTELNDIAQGLPANVNLTFLIHACYSGSMFSYAHQVRGIALTSVGPDVPAVVSKEPDRKDFTTIIRDDIIKQLPAAPIDPDWKTYQQVLDEVAREKVSGRTPSGESFEGHAEMYWDRAINPSVLKFLRPIQARDEL